MGRRSARQAGKMLRYRASLITPPPSRCLLPILDTVSQGPAGNWG